MFPGRFIARVGLLFVVGGAFAPPAISQSDPGLASQSRTSPDNGNVDHTLLIFDASENMSGLLGGQRKMDVAKSKLSEALARMPAARRLGLVAYGHRGSGQCDDIATLESVSAGPQAVSAALATLQPLGRAPLISALAHAAAESDHISNPTTVVLVAGGLGNCDADPCALARSLQAQGLDFKAHVIGLGLTDLARSALSCVAQQTGGEFFEVDSSHRMAEALSQVLGQRDVPPVAVTAAPPAPARARLEAPAQAVEGEPLSIAWSGPDNLGASISIARLQDPPGLHVYSVPAATARNDYLRAAGNRQVDTDGDGNFDQDDLARVVLNAPVQQGDYEVRYTLRNPRVILARRPLQVIDSRYSLAAPEWAATSARIEVAWGGLHTPGDLVTLVPLGYPQPFDSSRYFVLRPGEIAVLNTPITPGNYEIRYVMSGGSTERSELRYAVQHAVSIAVGGAPFSTPPPAAAPPIAETFPDAQPLPAPAAIPPPAPAPSPLPAAPLPEPYADNPVPDAPRANEALVTNPASISPGVVDPAINEPSYPSADPLLGEVPAVDRGPGVFAPELAVGGSTIEVHWGGPAQGWEDDYISVVDKGTSRFNRASWARVSKNGVALNPVQIRVPDLYGEYEVVYVAAPGNRFLHRSEILIEKAQASVDAPSHVRVGEPFEVRFEGEGFAADRIVAVKRDFPDSAMWRVPVQYGFAASDAQGFGTVGANAIRDPGIYEVRYVSGLQHQVLARDEFTVLP